MCGSKTVAKEPPQAGRPCLSTPLQYADTCRHDYIVTGFYDVSGALTGNCKSGEDKGNIAALPISAGETMQAAAKSRSFSG